MTSTREQGRIERRRLILEQAATIVSECGYNGFGLQELAARCGLTKPGLLHHFPSKEALLVAVLRDRDRRDEIAVVAATRAHTSAGNPPGPSLSEVRETLHAIVARNGSQPELVRLYAVLRAEALSPSHPAHDYFNAREAAARDLFAQMLSPHVADPPAAARYVMALMLGLEMQWLRDGLSFDLVEAWDGAVSALLD
ncbi:TetR/AcrR family transcriptional regulator [Sphingobium sp. H39-3-25]|uniref:TetR/AcrR family transcriptional regulator n=1 Tax=Sphingobium arseniciresistens TaxID=3030834 RepID=UPI0023B908E7|nr:TetR/AcrR family transcriptional regulator [Sphingobium arseniciresistens]